MTVQIEEVGRDRSLAAVVRCDTDRCAAKYSTQVRSDEKPRAAKARAVREACASRTRRRGASVRRTRARGGAAMTRRDVAVIIGAVLLGALVAVIVHEREMTMRALVTGLVRCVEAR